MTKDNHGFKLLIYVVAAFFLIASVIIYAEKKFGWNDGFYPSGTNVKVKKYAHLDLHFHRSPEVENMEYRVEEKRAQEEAKKAQERINEGRGTSEDYDRQSDYVRDYCS